MKVESAIGNSIELLEPALGIAPEALNAIDVMRALHKLIVGVIDSEVLRVSDINQAIIAAPTVRVDGGVNSDSTPNNGLKCGFLAVRDDLCIHAAIALEDAEDNGLAAGSAASLATDTARSEVRFVHLDFTGGKGRGALTLFGNTLSYFEKNRSHAAARESCQLRCMTSRQIKCKVAHKLARFTLRNFRPPVIAV